MFVADTSGSLSDEQDAIARALASLVANIDPQGDYHIGALPAHGSLGPSTGLLWKSEIDLCPLCAITNPANAGQRPRGQVP